MVSSFPKVYPILDSSIIPSIGRSGFLHKLGSSLFQAGVTLLEYRNKQGDEAQLSADAEILRATMPAGQVKLILDDRAKLVVQFGFDGVHVDAGDVSPAEARRILGPDRIVGTFGGSEALIPGILGGTGRLLCRRPRVPDHDQADGQRAYRSGRRAALAGTGRAGPCIHSRRGHHAGNSAAGAGGRCECCGCLRRSLPASRSGSRVPQVGRRTGLIGQRSANSGQRAEF